jgi:hypothetical protein
VIFYHLLNYPCFIWPGEVKAIRDKAEAVRTYLRTEKNGYASQESTVVRRQRSGKLAVTCR